MKRKFLEDLGLEKEVIDKIMAENGSDINAVKSEQENLKQQLEAVNQQLSERDEQLEDLKKSSGDNTELKAQLETLQAENKAAKEQYEADMKNLKLETAIKLAVGETAQDADLVVGLFDKSKLVLSEDGKVSGLDEQLKTLKEEKAFLFKVDTNPTQKSSYAPQGGKTPEKGLAAQIAETRNKEMGGNPYENAWS